MKAGPANAIEGAPCNLGQREREDRRRTAWELGAQRTIRADLATWAFVLSVP